MYLIDKVGCTCWSAECMFSCLATIITEFFPAKVFFNRFEEFIFFCVGDKFEKFHIGFLLHSTLIHQRMLKL